MLMATHKNNATNGAIASALLMLAALLWLTISTPFVYAGRQAAAKHLQKDKAAQQDAPLQGAAEERAESGINTLSEYLHEQQQPCPYGQPLLAHEKWHIAHPYISFHPEFHCPPPNLG